MYKRQLCEPKGLGIIVKAQHYCMKWRGVKEPNTSMINYLNDLLQMPEDELIEERYKKFRVLGKFIEANNFEEIYSEIPQKTE